MDDKRETWRLFCLLIYAIINIDFFYRLLLSAKQAMNYKSTKYNKRKTVKPKEGNDAQRRNLRGET